MENQNKTVGRVALTESRRSDAIRNRKRIVQAAIATFAASGLRATIPEIAAAAGVGSASVYRNFPTKAELVAAVIASEGAEVSRSIVELSTRESGDDGLRKAVLTLFSALAANRLLADALADGGAAAFSSVMDALLILVDHGKRTGAVDATLDPVDFTLVLCGTVRQLRFLDDRDPDRWARAAQLVVRALAPN